MDGTVRGQMGKGVFTIMEVRNNWGRLKSGAGWIYLGNPEYCTIMNSVALPPKKKKRHLLQHLLRSLVGGVPYLVRITADVLNIRSGPGTDNSRVGSISDHGVYTIVAESSGKGATLWGKLKSGAGWISLDYVKKL